MILLLIGVSLVQEPTAEELVRKLTSDSVEERDQAARELKKRGEAALPALEKASREKNGEVAARARELLDPLYGELGKEMQKKFEETVLKAKSLKVRFKYEGKGPRGDLGSGKGSGTLFLKEGGLVRFEMTSTVLEEEHHVLIVSNGKRLVATMDSAPPFTKDAPKDMYTLFGMGLARGGVVVMTSRQEAQDPREFLRIEAPRAGPGGEGEERSLIYRILLSGTEEAADVKLWFEAKSLKGHRRRVVLRKKEEIVTTFEETYEEFSVNPELSDELFKVPEK